ncbi:hypothetical protein [Hymenobacter sp. YC55]|uniref:hypothetical protein n=1 Tax=Hymenobacter sp. YC55 TaxID=3034019 RepID=UPI0023F9DE97|nr:hypothetical protein [Hymenobacter sp. YC55]MDF7815738.1 hypothetical protein [Hymenobacter sp. YC55]
MATFGIVIGDIVADFEFGFGQTWKASAIEQLGFQRAPTGFRVGVVIAIAPSAHAW